MMGETTFVIIIVGAAVWSFILSPLIGTLVRTTRAGPHLNTGEAIDGTLPVLAICSLVATFGPIVALALALDPKNPIMDKAGLIGFISDLISIGAFYFGYFYGKRFLKVR